MTLSFTKAERLNSAEFDVVFKKGRRFKSDLFLFLYYHTETGPNKLGLITAKKKLKTAIKRNFARRTVKEHFRLNKLQLQHYHIVVIANHIPKELSPVIQSKKQLREHYHTCCKDFFDYLAKRSKRDAKD